MGEHLRAQGLEEIDRGGHATSSGTVRGQSGVLHVLGTDTHDHPATLVAPQRRTAVEHAVVELGMKVDRDNDLLFVAGGATGQAYVYDLGTKKTVKVYDLAPAGASFINDVTLTRDGAWFTNSRAGELYRIPISRDGKPGDARTLVLDAPAGTVDEGFNLNGIAAADDGRQLIVAHTGRGALYAVDPDDGSNKLIKVTDSSGAPTPVTNVDGIVVRNDTLWAVAELPQPGQQD